MSADKDRAIRRQKQKRAKDKKRDHRAEKPSTAAATPAKK